MATKVVFITSGTTYTIPSDFLSLISIEAIGAGSTAPTGSATGTRGSGGGAYAKSTAVTGLTAGGTAYVSIGATGTAGAAAGDTWFNAVSNAAPTTTAQGTLAKGSAGQSGGLSTSSIGTTTFAGGNGGSLVSGSGSGGGGAAGPGGIGGNGATPATNNAGGGGGSAGSTGAGGNGSGTTGGTAGTGGGATGGTGGAFGGAVGGAGTYWTATGGGTAGSGAGGGGGRSVVAGNGGLYGGGGGGRGSAGASGGGTAGIIVFTYDAAIPLTTAYWVGGNGTWNTSSSTNWASTSGGAGGAGVVDSTTDVIINAASGSPTITLSGNISCKSLTTTGATCNLASTGALTVSGNITLSSTTTWSGTGLLTLNATNTITAPSTTFSCSITSTVSTTLATNLTLGATNTFTYSPSAAGTTLNLAGFTLSTGLFVSGTTNSRTVAFGTGNITTTGSGTVFNMGTTALNFTGTPVVNLTYSGSTACSIVTPSIAATGSLISYNITAGTYALSIAGTAGYSVNNLNFTGFAGTWNTGTQVGTITGNLTLVSGMSLVAGSGGLTFNSTTTQTITSANKTFADIVCNNVGGTVVLNGNLTATGTLLINNSGAVTLNLAGYTLTCGTFSAPGVNSKTLQFGTGNITTTGSGTAFNVVGTNLTYTGTPTVNISNNSSTATTITATSFTETNALDFNITTGTYSLTVTTASFFKNLNFTGFTGDWSNNGTKTIYGNLTLSSGMTYAAAGGITFAGTSGTKTITSNGKTFTDGLTFNGLGSTFNFSSAVTMAVGTSFSIINGTVNLQAGTTNIVRSFSATGGSLGSTTPGIQATISQASGTAQASTMTLQDSNATGGATWNLIAGTDNGNNTGWNYINQLYWVGGNGTWDVSTTTNWALTSGGTGGATVPTSAINVIVDGNSGSPTITLTGSINCKSLTTTGATCNLTSTGTLTVSGNMTLSSTTTWSGTGTLTINADSTITAPSITFPCSINATASVTLGGNLTLGTTNTFTFSGTNPTLTLNNNTLSTGLFVSTAGLNRVFAFGTGNITTTGSGTVFNATGSNNLTYTGTPTVNISNNSATAATITTSAFTETNAFDFNITTGNYVLTLTTGSIMRSLNLTGFTGTQSGTRTLTLYGNLTLNAGITWTSTGAITFASTTTTQTITSNGLSITSPINRNGVGGSLQLVDNLTTTAAFTLTNGNLDLNNNTLTSGSFVSSTATTRTLAFGTGNITTTGTGTVFNATGNLLTTSGSKTVNISNNSATATTITAPAFTETNALDFNITTGTYTLTSTSGNIFRSLNFTGFTGSWTPAVFTTFFGNLTLVSGMTHTAGTGTFTFVNTTGTATLTSAGKTLYNITLNGVGGTLAFNGATTLNTLTLTNGTLVLPAGLTTTVNGFVTSGTSAKFLTSSSPGTQASISDTTGTITATYLSIQDSNATGGATWNAGAGSVDLGNNTGWFFAGGGNFLMMFF